jgi:hypothetical protein
MKQRIVAAGVGRNAIQVLHRVARNLRPQPGGTRQLCQVVLILKHYGAGQRLDVGEVAFRPVLLREGSRSAQAHDEQERGGRAHRALPAPSELRGPVPPRSVARLHRLARQMPFDIGTALFDGGIAVRGVSRQGF